ncbi:MAG: hypothetical protein A3F74_18255 [Betaproteobacteria bacterium RIFCSPLOWO2_12_FULL_62_58]|nr:MAG: hypothetical protein A3F74_18255 [Betaproteobacteria bacterium RIFCSPLOWO2_12_FULL_62_58]
MEALSLPELLFFCLIVVLSYAIRGSAGFGGVTVPLLALILSLKIIVPVVTVLGLISSFVILKSDYRYIVWRDLWKIMPWSVFGIALGLYFFKTLDARTLAQALGAFVLAYGAYSLWATTRPGLALRLPMRAVTPAAGTLAGFVGTIFGAMAGVFFALYLDLLRFAKHEFRATVAAILFGMGVFRGAGYIAVGAFGHDALLACAAALPMMAIGIFIGNRIHANLDPLMFKRFIAIVLIVSGVPLLLR